MADGRGSSCPVRWFEARATVLDVLRNRADEGGDRCAVDWVRFNRLLEMLDAVHGPLLTPGSSSALPYKALRIGQFGSQSSWLYLLGSDNPGAE